MHWNRNYVTGGRRARARAWAGTGYNNRFASENICSVAVVLAVVNGINVTANTERVIMRPAEVGAVIACSDNSTAWQVCHESSRRKSNSRGKSRKKVPFVPLSYNVLTTFLFEFHSMQISILIFIAMFAITHLQFVLQFEFYFLQNYSQTLELFDDVGHYAVCTTIQTHVSSSF